MSEICGQCMENHEDEPMYNRDGEIDFGFAIENSSRSFRTLKKHSLSLERPYIGVYAQLREEELFRGPKLVG